MYKAKQKHNLFRTCGENQKPNKGTVGAGKGTTENVCNLCSRYWVLRNLHKILNHVIILDCKLGGDITRSIVFKWLFTWLKHCDTFLSQIWLQWMQIFVWNLSLSYKTGSSQPTYCSPLSYWYLLPNLREGWECSIEPSLNNKTVV